MKNRYFTFLVFLIISCNTLFSQDGKLLTTITDKMVIGFPGLTVTQLDQVKTQFLQYAQIQSAYYVFGNYNCMFIKLDINATSFKQVYDVVKVTGDIYDIQKCYLKPYPDYDFGEQNIGSTPTYTIKP